MATDREGTRYAQYTVGVAHRQRLIGYELGQRDRAVSVGVHHEGVQRYVNQHLRLVRRTSVVYRELDRYRCVASCGDRAELEVFGYDVDRRSYVVVDFQELYVLEVTAARRVRVSGDLAQQARFAVAAYEGAVALYG